MDMEAREQAHDEVDYVSGKTRIFGIVGHPIEQVRSPEMFTAEFRRRGCDAILIPLHVLPDDFDATLPRLLRLSVRPPVIFRRTAPPSATHSTFRQDRVRFLLW